MGHPQWAQIRLWSYSGSRLPCISLVMLETVEFQMQNTLDVKTDKNILLAPFKRVRDYYLGQMLWMSLHKVKMIDNKVYTGIMDT